MSSMEVGIVALGGGLGAILRYLVTSWVQHRVDFFPWGTVVVNLVGSFLIGIVLEMTLRGFLSSQARLLLGVGILGGFTTFSSLSWEMLTLLEEGDILPAFLYGFGSLVIGVFCAWLGSIVVRWVF
ncbi:crcB protein [Thermomicrobium roseum DSM 5159]|uniref:Fluoride-specific ion channel FluC n=2 Tax=Thermomicrobium roseum TaxID=500 RepID=B9L2H7_THERP|nr:crcB protein [Thermomicrobium roseum DSM 5159]